MPEALHVWSLMVDMVSFRNSGVWACQRVSARKETSFPYVVVNMQCNASGISPVKSEKVKAEN